MQGDHLGHLGPSASLLWTQQASGITADQRPVFANVDIDYAQSEILPGGECSKGAYLSRSLRQTYATIPVLNSIASAGDYHSLGIDICQRKNQGTQSIDLSGIAMTYTILDNDELLRLALDAMNTGKDADAVVMLKTLVERDPGNAYGQYLLAAQHAQMGLMDRAEAGFRAAVGNGLELPIARFQLGQLLLVKGDSAQAKATLEPLTTSDDLALAAYAKALMAAADENADTAIRQLNEGLAFPQAIPALGADMQRLLGNLQGLASQGEAGQATVGGAPAAAMYLSNYGRQN